LGGRQVFNEIKRAKLSSSVPVIAIVKNEIFFLPAFLDHYRGLGTKHFVFLDDRSEDGTSEFLLAQDDCTIVASEFSFAQEIDGKKAHFLWRTALPQKYCDGGWGVHVDADELLEIPPGFDDIESFTHALDDRDVTAVGAVMVDFYPERALDLKQNALPQSKEELLSRYPYFDDCHYGVWDNGRNQFLGTQCGVRHRMMLAHEITNYARTPSSPMKKLQVQLRKFWGTRKTKSFCALSKVPLVKWDKATEHLSPHKLNRPPAPGILLPLMHFKLTSSLLQKIEFAISSGNYHKQSAEYRSYRDLLAAMMEEDASFLDSCSRRYSGKADFLGNRILQFEPVKAHS
jgi:Glycosyl transferase family 2